MSYHGVNKIYKHQQKTLIPSTFKKGFISSINAGTRTASIYFSENPNTVIRGVPLAAHIVASTVNIGAQCRVDVFNETGANNMVIAYVW